MSICRIHDTMRERQVLSWYNEAIGPHSLGFCYISLSAQESLGDDLEKLLREALIEEEASQGLTQPAPGYKKLLETYHSHRQFAATALFWFVEVWRKQNRPKEVVKLYLQ
ncbi:MAG: hypothetical protein L7V86_17735 [Verrucomicrobiales bacterium]|nr:hypothetical protein [Verrucomicrobiales bacterium]MDB4468016.1 hypothetical protein [Verrucomicrobiales bacterium]MDF1789298.1 hypothetical protein [Verrucomicrobiales bacterium]